MRHCALLFVVTVFACSPSGRTASKNEGSAASNASAPKSESDVPATSAATDAVVRRVPDDIASGLTLKALVTEGINRPVGVEFIPGDASRIFVVEQAGTVRILRLDAEYQLAPAPFLDIRGTVSKGNEQGLLGLAFHPDHVTNGLLYINYTNRDGDTRVVEYTVDKADKNKVDMRSQRVLLALKQPFANHNAGDLDFGPDGKLYVGTGDGGAGGDPKGAGQDDNNKLAKMLTIDVASGTVEIVQKGLRNPWRIHFDRKTSDFYIADVGQNAWEEVNVVAADNITGHNFGWNIMEGNHCYPEAPCSQQGFTAPVVEFGHGPECSVTGGVVYRGKALPALDGVYFYADFCSGLLRSFRWSKDGIRDHWDWKPALNPDNHVKLISAFGQDSTGEVYLASLENKIYKLAPR